MKQLYFDYAATTPVRSEVLEAMLPFFTECFGNPSGSYETAREARWAVEAARRQVAEAIGASPREIFFTSGGTESDNWAIRGTALANANKGRHIILSSVEHHAVLHACRQLEAQGWELTILPVDSYGVVHPETLASAIRPDTVLVSVMTANNEIGTLQPIAELSAVCREHAVFFHTDAVQAVGSIPVDVSDTRVDLLSLTAHKLYGPKGIGALYVRRGTRFDPLLAGGAQEHGMRPGTENTAGIVGFGKAVSLAVSEMEQNSGKIRGLRDKLIHSVLSSVPGAVLTGHPQDRLPNNASFRIPGVDSASLVARLDLAGFAASGGSACTSGSMEPSHVLLAIRCSEEEAFQGIRFTLGRDTTPKALESLCSVFPGIVEELRNTSV